MSKIFVEILEMMAFCFAIGFAVAAVIKLIAYAADYFNFSHSHVLELKRLKNIRRLQKLHAMHLTSISRTIRGEMPPSEKELADLGEDAVSGNYFPRSSMGLSEFSIMDYYYPEEKIEIIEKSGK